MANLIADTYVIRHFVEKLFGLRNYSINEASKALIKTTRPDPFLDYNHKNECIFIHIPRTGGTAVAKSLFDRWGQGHVPLYVYRSHSKKLYEKYFKFSFVRNPYSRFVSAFYQAKSDFHKSDWAKKYVKGFDSVRKFARTIGENKILKNKIVRTSFFRPQWEYIYIDGSIGVDFLGKFEFLQSNFEEICREVGITGHLEKVNKSDHNEYKAYLNEEVEKTLYKLYKFDFQAFGYERVSV